MTGVLFSIHFTAICLAIFVSNLCARLNSKIVSYCLTDISPVTYPDNGWSTSLTKMPMFTKAEMNEHITRSGKHIANKTIILFPLHCGRRKHFLRTSTFTKQWQPVTSTVFISKLNAVIALGKMILCAH